MVRDWKFKWTKESSVCHFQQRRIYCCLRICWFRQVSFLSQIILTLNNLILLFKGHNWSLEFQNEIFSNNQFIWKKGILESSFVPCRFELLHLNMNFINTKLISNKWICKYVFSSRLIRESNRLLQNRITGMQQSRTKNTHQDPNLIMELQSKGYCIVKRDENSDKSSFYSPRKSKSGMV